MFVDSPKACSEHCYLREDRRFDKGEYVEMSTNSGFVVDGHGFRR